MTDGWFDAHVMIGVHPEQNPGVVDVDDHVSRHQLSGALVGSIASWLHDPLAGNAEATAASRATPSALACWTAIPETPGELDDLRGLVKQAVSEDVAAFRLFPSTHGFDPTDPELDGFFDALADNGLPLCMNRPELDWTRIDQLAQRHPGLTMIISLIGYRELRQLARMLGRHPRLHVDMANFASHQGVEWIVDHFGAERLLFATGAGLRDPGESLARLGWADLTEPDRQAIGSGNAGRLFGRHR